MAGPIIEALRRFRENRPARVEARRARFRELLNPLDSIQNTDSMQGVSVDRQPTRRGGMFASLGGVQTARHDMKGAPQPAVPQRAPQQNPAGPDTVRSRAYDGDGTGMASQAKAPAPTKTASQRQQQPTESPDRTYGSPAPQVVRSETQDLPAPAEDIRLPSPAGDGDQLPAHIQQMQRELQELDAQIQAGNRTMAGINNPDQFRMAQGVLAGVTQSRHSKAADLEAAMEQYRATPAYKSGMLQPLMASALKTGDWETFDRHASAQHTIVTKDGAAVPENVGQKMARPVINNYVRQSFERHNGLPTDPEQRASLIRGLRYAYPVVRDAKGTMNRDASIQEITFALNSEFNQGGDPELADYFRNLAIVVVGPTR